ncbi:MAG: response regulator [Pseudomonadales bacterium]|nr:response regulator [Pseudomonadales bacterium]
MTLLLVEDDAMIGNAIVTALQDAAYAVDWQRDAHHLLALLDSSIYEAMLLDLSLPDADGLDMLRQLRLKGHELPVIIVTARDDIAARVAGLDAGADDYLVKPFALQELLARLRAVQRRRAGSAHALLDAGAWQLDPASQEIVTQGQRIALTGHEFALLRTLALHPGHLHTREAIEQAVYGWDTSAESNTIDVLIHGIRKKLGSTTAIRNVRGVGWFIPRC